MRVVVFLFGLVLLLPGACSLGYMVLVLPSEFKSTYNDPYLSLAELLWAVCFLISFGGVLMIRYAWRDVRGERRGGPRSGDPPTKRD
jgi:hypothetical protein